MGQRLETTWQGDKGVISLETTVGGGKEQVVPFEVTWWRVSRATKGSFHWKQCGRGQGNKGVIQ